MQFYLSIFLSVLTLMCISKNVNAVGYPCKICHVNVNNKDSAAQCDICQSWVHIKCNKLNHVDCKYLQGSNEPLSFLLQDFIPSIANSLSTRYQE